VSSSLYRLRLQTGFLPAKFNKKLWIKRGGYIIVEEGDVDVQDKVTATIVKVLYEQDVKALKKLSGVWYVRVSPLLKIASLPNVSLLVSNLVLLSCISLLIVFYSSEY